MDTDDLESQLQMLEFEEMANEKLIREKSANAGFQKQEKPKRWLSPVPKACDLCGGPLKEVFVDGRTNFGWGIMCRKCHRMQGCGLGTGRGQMYDVETRNKIGG